MSSYPRYEAVYGFSVADAIVMVGDHALRLSVTFDPSQDSPAATEHLYQALTKIAASGDQLQVSFRGINAITASGLSDLETHLRDSSELIDAGLNPRLCKVITDTPHGGSRFAVTHEDFMAIEAKQGNRAWNALSRGANTRYDYTDYLERFVVRDRAGQVVGFDAIDFWILASESNQHKLAGIRNFGPLSFDLINTLSGRLYFKLPQAAG